MGCDIHCFSEKRLSNGTWQCTNPMVVFDNWENVFKKFEEYEDTGKISKDFIFASDFENDREAWILFREMNGTPGTYEKVVKNNLTSDIDWNLQLSQFYGYRNYGLFAVLSNVRNYDELIPIEDLIVGSEDFSKNDLKDMFKIPDDVSEDVAIQAYVWGTSAHTPTCYDAEALFKVLKMYSEKNLTEEEQILKPFVDRIKIEMERCKIDNPKDFRVVIWYDN